MRTLLLALAYDGACFHGWQVQKNASSVQQTFQDAVERVLGERPDCKGCSRTDSGVHANCFCVSLRTSHPIPCERLQAALNHFSAGERLRPRYPEAPESLHARYSCLGKEYEYRIWNARARNPFLRGRALHYYYPLDLELLGAAACFLGPHDFSSFCTLDGRGQRGFDPYHYPIRSGGARGDSVIYTVAADGFLYNMVRILVGTQLYVAQGKIKPEELPRILEAGIARRRARRLPPQGLYLNRVFYRGLTCSAAGFQGNSMSRKAKYYAEDTGAPMHRRRRRRRRKRREGCPRGCTA